MEQKNELNLFKINIDKEFETEIDISKIQDYSITIKDLKFKSFNPAQLEDENVGDEVFNTVYYKYLKPFEKSGVDFYADQNKKLYMFVNEIADFYCMVENIKNDYMKFALETKKEVNTIKKYRLKIKLIPKFENTQQDYFQPSYYIFYFFPIKHWNKVKNCISFPIMIHFGFCN